MYGARAGYHTVLFQGDKPGGLMMDAPYIENMPGMEKLPESSIMEKFETQAHDFVELPFTIKKVDFQSFKLVTSNNIEIYALSVVIATGVSQKKLGIEGEETYWRKGVFALTTACDAPLARGKEAVIVGGNDTAVARALQIIPLANKVTLLTRAGKLDASPENQKKLAGFENVDVLLNKYVTKIIGDGATKTNIEFFDIVQKKHLI